MKYIAVLLVMAACAASAAQAAIHDSECISPEEMQRKSDKFQNCRDRQNKLKSLAPSRATGSDDECDRKLLEEIEKNSADCLKVLDQQLEILEKLLLESPPVQPTL